MRQRVGSASILGLAVLACFVVLAGNGGRPLAARQATPPALGTPPAGLPGVVSEVLARGLPATAAGQELAIGRVSIAPGASIPTHEHPGTQVASIVSGELTYSVLTGEVPLTRAGSDGSAEPIRAGQTVVLRAGDAIVEQPGAIHQAHNAGTEPVVILLATLFEAGQPRTLFVAGTPIP